MSGAVRSSKVTLDRSSTPLVIAEASYLLDRTLGQRPNVALFRSIADGALRVETLVHEDWVRITELVGQ